MDLRQEWFKQENKDMDFRRKVCMYWQKQVERREEGDVFLLPLPLVKLKHFQQRMFISCKISLIKNEED